MGSKGSCDYCIHWNSKLSDPDWHLDRTGWCRYHEKYTLHFDDCDDYEENEKGSDSACFLTTACVSFKGLADDCEELTKLRSFRDTYLAKTPCGKALIDEYYKIAPDIVIKIDDSSEKETIYQYIYQKIQECVQLIDKRKYDEVVNVYKDMVYTVDMWLNK